MVNQLSTAQHELTHVLGFSSWMYQYYQDAQLNTLGVDKVQKTIGTNKYGIISPKVISTANTYFSCTSGVDNIGLEEYGGGGTAGSHWDRADLGDECMTGVGINEPKYSIFTLALMEDSGWYQANYNLADTLTWGYQAGCEFISKKCTSTT